jgi:hypothetical protein
MLMRFFALIVSDSGLSFERLQLAGHCLMQTAWTHPNHAWSSATARDPQLPFAFSRKRSFRLRETPYGAPSCRVSFCRVATAEPPRSCVCRGTVSAPPRQTGHRRWLNGQSHRTYCYKVRDGFDDFGLCIHYEWFALSARAHFLKSGGKLYEIPPQPRYFRFAKLRERNGLQFQSHLRRRRV